MPNTTSAATPPVPDYLRDTYTWAYLDHRIVPWLDQLVVVSAILWGNASRLMNAAVREFSAGQRVLQAAAVYGDFSQRLARRLGGEGQLTVLNVASIQIANSKRPAKSSSRSLVIPGRSCPPTSPFGGHVDTSTINLPSAGRRRGRYSDAFKAEIVAACEAPGISTAAVARANGLNANLVRRWVLESDPAHKPETRGTSPQAPSPALPLPPSPDFVPLALNTSGADIRIELRKGDQRITVHWPLSASEAEVQLGVDKMWAVNSKR